VAFITTLAELGPAFGLDGTDSAGESRSPCGEAIERIGHLATGGKEDRNGPWLVHRTQGLTPAKPAPCRYVERNALRANLIERAEDWRYGSLRRWLQKPEPEVAFALANTPSAWTGPTSQ